MWCMFFAFVRRLFQFEELDIMEEFNPQGQFEPHPVVTSTNIPTPTPEDTNGGDSEAQMAARAKSDALTHQRRVLAALQITHLFGDVLPDNPTLLRSLEMIHNAGAPTPTIVREHLPFPGSAGETVDVDVYEFRPDAKNEQAAPGAILRSAEYLLAVTPYVVINELRNLRIIPAPELA